ncbi:3,4-dihydroxy-2-butanone-4-phosphate synthase, partial [Staphylococcus aureus]|nr:bifunctional 3,4-dihydroxy-2-butanone-4-phosphate synthase/GTP cyclohydrolase II [Staphylococcus aureus]
MQIVNIDSALMALTNGVPIMVVDDENRENEGYVLATTEWMNVDTINYI